MLTKSKLVLAAILVLGAGSLAQASNENDAGNETGGYVLPPNLDGVNPLYHPRWFPNYGSALRAYARANRTIYSGGAGFYAFVPSHNYHRSGWPR